MADRACIDQLKRQIAAIETGHAGPAVSTSEDFADNCRTDSDDSAFDVFSKSNENDDDTEAKCLKSAMSSLTASDQPTSKIRSKLIAKGFDEAIVENVIERLTSYGFLDDRRFAESYIRSRLEKGRGIPGIKRELRGFGIDPEEFTSTFLELTDDYPDETQRAYDFLVSHPPRAKNVRESSYRKLITRGFSSPAAASAARRYTAEYIS